MLTGLILFTAFLFGGGLMSYWWTTYVLSDNITQSSIVMEDVTQKLLQCQGNLTKLKQEFSHVQEGFTVLKSEVTEVKNGINGTNKGVKAKLTQIKQDFSNVKTGFTVLKSEVTEANNGITGTIEGVEANLTQIKKDFSHVQTGFTVLKSEVTEVKNGVTGTIKGVKANLTQIKLDLKNVQDNFVYLKNEVTKVFNGVTGTIEGVKANMTQIKLDFKNVQDTFVYLKNEVTKVCNGMTSIIEGVKEEMKEDYLLLKRDMQILTGTKQINDNKYITYSETVFILLVGLILEALILFLIAYKFFPRRIDFNGSQGSNHDDPHESQWAQVPVRHPIKQKRWSILDQIDITRELEKSICTLSFHEETQDLHHRIITSVFQEEEVEIKPFLLEKTDPDVLDIPRCQFIFVFVDFNETNVILENQGDKRLVSVQACMKIGADVFVIYTRDRDSSHLEDGTLYNKDLSAFTEHFLLKELTAKNKGLSVNDTLTQYQKSHIRKIVLEK